MFLYDIGSTNIGRYLHWTLQSDKKQKRYIQNQDEYILVSL